MRLKCLLTCRTCGDQLIHPRRLSAPSQCRLQGQGLLIGSGTRHSRGATFSEINHEFTNDTIIESDEGTADDVGVRSSVSEPLEARRSRSRLATAPGGTILSYCIVLAHSCVCRHTFQEKLSNEMTPITDHHTSKPCSELHEGY